MSQLQGVPTFKARIACVTRSAVSHHRRSWHSRWVGVSSQQEAEQVIWKSLSLRQATVWPVSISTQKLRFHGAALVAGSEWSLVSLLEGSYLMPNKAWQVK